MADAADLATQGKDNHAVIAAQSTAQATASTKAHARKDKDLVMATQQGYALQAANGKASKTAITLTAGLVEATPKQQLAAAQTMMLLLNTETMAALPAHAHTL